MKKYPAVCFFSITTYSHFSALLVSFTSLSQHEKDVGMIGFIVDGNNSSQNNVLHQKLHLLKVDDCVDHAKLTAMHRRYTASELCFAMKPFLFRFLFTQGVEQAHYVDGDIYFFSSVRPLIEELGSHDILLTPHYLTPLPDDGYMPDTLTLLQAGVFNGGYVGVRNTIEGRRFVNWWADHVFEDGRNDPRAGMCGDQRWLDLVPVLFPGLGIIRHHGTNVALLEFT